MEKMTAVRMVREYAKYLRDLGETDPVLADIDTRWPSDGSEAKAMRWLGFMQGALYVKRVFSLEQIKEHSKNGKVSVTDL